MPRTFLATRTPPAPVPLASWLEKIPLGGDGTSAALLRGGLAELDASRAAPGRVRGSAFHLLAADALLTYACEAALAAGDPRVALVEILQQAAAPRR